MLDVARMPLLDAFIQQVLAEVSILVKRGFARDYRRFEENLPCISGKLLVANQVRHNTVFKHFHYVAFDEMTLDRPENRLFRRAQDWVVLCSSGQLERLAQELRFAFSGIEPSRQVRHDLQAWQRGRHLRHYEPLKPWIELIFNNLSPTSTDGGRDMLSLHFPMERVFEKYVLHCLRRQFPGWNVKSQAASQSLLTHTPSTSNEPRGIFQLNPDVLIESEKQLIVADTKWKLIDQQAFDKKYGISQSDLYQMLAYHHGYQLARPEQDVWLIFPRTADFGEPLPSFKFHNGKRLHALPFDLDRGLLTPPVIETPTSDTRLPKTHRKT